MLEKRLESWLGAKETEIIQVYGIPDSIYTTDNVKYILYEIEKSQYVLNIGYGVVVTEGCEVTFNIQDNIISSYTYKRWSINDCLALIYSSRETDFVDSNVGQIEEFKPTIILKKCVEDLY